MRQAEGLPIKWQIWCLRIIPNKALPKDKLKRLSIDLDEELHWRFKIACARAKLKMTSELLEFVELRTAELEAKLDKERSF